MDPTPEQLRWSLYDRWSFVAPKEGDAINVLVTGGTGYIGSHAVVELMGQGHDVIVVDNLSNSRVDALERIREITSTMPRFYEVDLRDTARLLDVIVEHDVDAVLHFAGLKEWAASIRAPLAYYRNNIGGTISLCEAMEQAGVRTMVFSSSATVYGPANSQPISEGTPLAPMSPYARSKQIIEQILSDLAASNPDWRISVLRYFNPLGAHPSGVIGEDPKVVANNLLPAIAQVADGRRRELGVFGDDYPTRDGTPIRDYIHVVDLIRGHLKALDYLARNPGIAIHNLGTGRGYTVLEVIAAFERVINRKIAYTVVDRRPGDVAESLAEPGRARRELGWQAEFDLHDMCRHAWNWQQNRPGGYRAGRD